MSQAVGQLHEALQLSIEGTHNFHASPLGRASALSDTSDTVPAGQAATASSCADAIGEKAERRSSGRMMAKRAERSMFDGCDDDTMCWENTTCETERGERRCVWRAM